MVEVSRDNTREYTMKLLKLLIWLLLSDIRQPIKREPIPKHIYLVLGIALWVTSIEILIRNVILES